MSNWMLPLAELVKDPILIFILCLFALLAWIISSLLKTIKSQVSYERELLSQLSENATTLVRLTTLIETLIHLIHRRGGRDG